MTYAGRNQTLTANTEQNAQLIAQAAREMAMTNDASREKVPLRDLERVKRTASAYLDECAQTGTMPTVRGCAARLGVTRFALYDFERHHPGSEFSAWLQDFSDMCGEVMMAAAMQGSVSPVPAIFTAKARYSWREAPVQVELQASNAIGPTLSEEELRKRIVEDVVIDGVEYEES